ncbi:MAG: hypothetical protein ACYTFW_25975 [Planctomycetota bacterium]|jgi:hypothetical protein
MSLKTATLIALIGIIVHLCLTIPYMLGFSYFYGISPLLGRAISILSSIIFNGSIILFLAVFYSRQKE